MTLREPIERRWTGNKPGAVKGRRLFYVQRMQDFLARQMKGGA